MLTMGRSIRVLAVAVLMASLLWAGSAQGSTILHPNAKGWKITAPSWAVSLGAVVDVESVQDPDVLALEVWKNFTGSPDELGVMSSIGMNFTQVAEDASTASQIVILDEFVSNNTTEDWIDYHFKLATFGVASFNRDETFPSEAQPPQPGEDFSTDQFASHQWIDKQVPVGDEELFLFDGLVGQGEQFSPGGEPGGGALYIDVDLSGEDDAFFGLKEIPTIPEPAAMSVLALGGLLLLQRRRST